MKKIDKINIANNIFLLIFLGTNMILLFQNRVPSMSVMAIGALLGMSLLSTILSSYRFLAVLYLAAGLITTYVGNSGNATGIILIIFAIHFFHRDFNLTTIISLLTVIVIFLKSLINGYDILSTISIMAFYVGCFVLYSIIFLVGEENDGNKKRF